MTLSTYKWLAGASLLALLIIVNYLITNDYIPNWGLATLVALPAFLLGYASCVVISPGKVKKK
jgi:hypothetical protein